jgi:hypothetical protein
VLRNWGRETVDSGAVINAWRTSSPAKVTGYKETKLGTDKLCELNATVPHY